MPLACLSIPAPHPFPPGHFVSSKKTVKGTLRFHQKTAVGHFCFNKKKTVDAGTLPFHQKIASGQSVSIKKVVDDAPPFHKKRPAATLFQPEKNRRSRLKCSQCTVARPLHKRGYRFFRLYKKMILTPQDISERYLWAKQYVAKSRDWWLKTIHIHLDNHHFRVPTTANGRASLAKRAVRGVYRKKGIKADAIKPCYVKPSAKL